MTRSVPVVRLGFMTDNVSSAGGAIPPSERMRTYLREIGQGQRTGRDLTAEEARDAMSLILSGEATPAQAGGFLLLQRYKGESPEELLGFAGAIRAGANLIRPKVQGLLDVGSPYDGRKKSIVVSPASSIVVAAAGVPVVMHGEKGLGPKHGVPVGDVLEAMGVDVDAEADEVASSIEELGLGYLRSARFVPQVYAVKDLREEIALRTVFATIEKIYNPAKRGLQHHRPGAPAVHGEDDDGGDEHGLQAHPHPPGNRGQRGCADVAALPGVSVGGSGSGKVEGGAAIGAGAREIKIDASEFGLMAASKEEMAGGDAARNAEIAEGIFEGETSAFRDLVLLNAGIRIWLAERAPSIGDGVDLARGAIFSGAAKRKLEALRARKTGA